MMPAEYKNFIRKLANEWRGKSSEEIDQKIQQFRQDIKRELLYGSGLKK